MSLRWFSPPTSDDSEDETNVLSDPGRDQTSSNRLCQYGETQICENIYSKTYKKRQSYERKRNRTGITDASAFKTKSLHSVPQMSKKTISHSISAVKQKRGKPSKVIESLAIAKQLLEKAKGEKRFQLQKKEVNECKSSPVSRFGRTVKKKVLDYDDFTGGHRKRKLEETDMVPLKALKGEDGERLIQSGW